MDAKLIMGMFPRDRLTAVEKALREVGVERVNISKVRGYGEHPDYFAPDWMVEEVMVECVTRADEVDTVTAAIMTAAHTGEPGDGVVAVLPIEKLYLIRTRAEATTEEFWPKRVR